MESQTEIFDCDDYEGLFQQELAHYYCESNKKPRMDLHASATDVLRNTAAHYRDHQTLTLNCLPCKFDPKKPKEPESPLGEPNNQGPTIKQRDFIPKLTPNDPKPMPPGPGPPGPGLP